MPRETFDIIHHRRPGLELSSLAQMTDFHYYFSHATFNILRIGINFCPSRSEFCVLLFRLFVILLRSLQSSLTQAPIDHRLRIVTSSCNSSKPSSRVAFLKGVHGLLTPCRID